MSSPIANGMKSTTDSNADNPAKAQSRVDRRREWWSKNKEFRSKLSAFGFLSLF